MTETNNVESSKINAADDVKRKNNENVSSAATSGQCTIEDKVLRCSNNLQSSSCKDVCNRRDLQLLEAEKTIANKDVIIKMLQDQVKKLEESYKQNLKETEEFRFKYCMASEQMKRLKSCPKFKEKRSSVSRDKDIRDMKNDFSKWQKQCDDLLTNKESFCGGNKCSSFQKIKNLEKFMKGHYEMLQTLVGKIVEQRSKFNTPSGADIMSNVKELEDKSNNCATQILQLRKEIAHLKEENGKLQEQFHLSNSDETNNVTDDIAQKEKVETLEQSPPKTEDTQENKDEDIDINQEDVIPEKSSSKVSTSPDGKNSTSPEPNDEPSVSSSKETKSIASSQRKNSAASSVLSQSQRIPSSKTCTLPACPAFIPSERGNFDENDNIPDNVQKEKVKPLEQSPPETEDTQENKDEDMHPEKSTSQDRKNSTSPKPNDRPSVASSRETKSIASSQRKNSAVSSVLSQLQRIPSSSKTCTSSTCTAFTPSIQTSEHKKSVDSNTVSISKKENSQPSQDVSVDRTLTSSNCSRSKQSQKSIQEEAVVKKSGTITENEPSTKNEIRSFGNQPSVKESSVTNPSESNADQSGTTSTEDIPNWEELSSDLNKPQKQTTVREPPTDDATVISLSSADGAINEISSVRTEQSSAPNEFSFTDDNKNDILQENGVVASSVLKGVAQIYNKSYDQSLNTLKPITNENEVSTFFGGINDRMGQTLLTPGNQALPKASELLSEQQSMVPTSAIEEKLNEIRERVSVLVDKQETACKELEMLKNQMMRAHDSTQSCNDNITKMKVTLDEQKETLLVNCQDHKCITDALTNVNDKIQSELNELKDKIDVLFKNVGGLKNKRQEVESIDTEAASNITNNGSFISDNQYKKKTYTENAQLPNDYDTLKKHFSELQQENADKDKQMRCLNDLIGYYHTVNEEVMKLCSNRKSDTVKDEEFSCSEICDPSVVECYYEKIQEENRKLKLTISNVVSHLKNKIEEINSNADTASFMSDKSFCLCMPSARSETKTAYTKSNNEDIVCETQSTKCEPRTSVSCADTCSPVCKEPPTNNNGEEKDEVDIQDIYNAVRISCSQRKPTDRSRELMSFIPSSSTKSVTSWDIETFGSGTNSAHCLSDCPLNIDNQCLLTSLHSYMKYLNTQMDIITNIENHIKQLHVDTPCCQLPDK